MSLRFVGAAVLVSSLFASIGFAGVGPSPLRISAEIEGVSVELRQTAIALGQGTVTFQNKVDIIGPERTFSEVFKVTASTEHVAHSAGLILSVALVANGQGFPSVSQVLAKFKAQDPAFSVSFSAQPETAQLVVSPAALVRLIVASVAIGPGGGCIEQLTSDLVSLQYPPNPCNNL